METIFLLIPLALVLVVAIIWFFLWAVRTDQFDDLEGPAHRILMDDDEPMIKPDDVEEASKDKTDRTTEARRPQRNQF